MNTFYQTITIMGIVKSVDPGINTFSLKTRSNDIFLIRISKTTNFSVLKNLNNQDYDRHQRPGGNEPVGKYLSEYFTEGDLTCVIGILYIDHDVTLFEAKTVYVLKSKIDSAAYLFEENHWWLSQTQVMANEWLDDLFDDKRNYRAEDFVRSYRTNLNILGLPTDNNIQEMATLSRYIYGLSSAFLLTGKQRYLDAAKAGVRFQRDEFRILTHDGKYCFWAYGRRKLKYGSEIIEYSLNGDDYGALPLYEQIYGLAGLTQYYRVTYDSEVLDDIMRTVNMFEAFYKDPEQEGYFSHIDYVTRKPDEEALGKNRSRKNWNSIGDHIPAYLINLILALEPLPLNIPNYTEVENFLRQCKNILENTSRLILKYFNTKDETYVNERFFKDWRVDHEWDWQQNRAIVGHNLKIAWNLTRVANYFKSESDKKDFAGNLMEFAENIALKMEKYGVDRIRGGCFDAVEREPHNTMPVEFTWGNTKDFWQQEQAILAYLVLFGNTEKNNRKPEYLRLAREMVAFWNLFFLDHDNRGIFFRVSDNGMPVIQGDYGNKATHSIAGYHSFELNFLAHIYMRTFLDTKDDSNSFVLYFKPAPYCRSVNVLPDFFVHGDLEIKSIKENGFYRKTFDPCNFQLELQEQHKEQFIEVEFTSKKK